MFSGIETQHLYSKEDNVWNDGEIIRHVHWDPITYGEYIERGGAVDSELYKDVQYTRGDRNRHGDKIPEVVSAVGDRCFATCTSLTSISIPLSVPLAINVSLVAHP